MSGGAPLRLADLPEQAGRTTTTLLASLSARLAVLQGISGAAAVGSLVAGLTALGREVSRTADGARLRRALEEGRAGPNAERVWRRLLLREWVRSVPPSPVLDQLRNDVALLLAPDLDASLDLLPVPPEPAGEAGDAPEDPGDALDLIVGLRAFAAEVIRSVDALAEPTADRAPSIRPGRNAGGDADPESAHGKELLR